MVSRTMLNNKHHFWFLSFSFAPNPSHLPVFVIKLPKYIQNLNTFYHPSTVGVLAWVQPASPHWCSSLRLCLLGSLLHRAAEVIFLFQWEQNSNTWPQPIVSCKQWPLLPFWTSFPSLNCTSIAVDFSLLLKHAGHILAFTFASILSVCLLPLNGSGFTSNATPLKEAFSNPLSEHRLVRHPLACPSYLIFFTWSFSLRVCFLSLPTKGHGVHLRYAPQSR